MDIASDPSKPSTISLSSQHFQSSPATQNAKQSLEYGTKIVGGVTPGRHGEHLGLPLLPTVRATEAKEHLKPDATAVYVAANQAAAAIEEAIEAEIPLIVAVAEHIPTIDLLRIKSILNTQSKSRLVGPNSPGVISAAGKCRIGFQPLPCFQPGVVGIVARSGTLSYETVASTTRADLGQSLVIGMGGDILPGTDFVDALTVFEHHEETKGIVLVGEIGGQSEIMAADWIRKPIMALVAGWTAPEGKVMGHAGAFIGSPMETAKEKIRRFELAGVVITNHPSKFGNCMRQLLDMSNSLGTSSLSHKGPSQNANILPQANIIQNRGVHYSAKRPKLSIPSLYQASQRHGHFLSNAQSKDLLSRVISTMRSPPQKSKYEITIRIQIDRQSGQLCATIEGSPEFLENEVDLETPETGRSELLKEIALESTRDTSERVPPSSCYLRSDFSRCKTEYELDDPTGFLPKLMQAFFDENMFFLHARFSKPKEPKWFPYQLADARVGTDALNYEASEQEHSKQEEEADREGIVYVRLEGEGTIGTLVNGAGLAMNTVDAVSDLGGSCSNFLDTGGKATSATVATSFQLVLADPRVKVVFVNIFGGLTLCDMIAEGIISAYRDLGIDVPVVARLRGTNEEVGQRMIAESGLPLHAFDDFEEAALKAIELAGGNHLSASQNPGAETEVPIKYHLSGDKIHA
ncbi:MAG: hypothetical protein Q9181_006984 [Wetmoreana brouardii]